MAITPYDLALLLAGKSTDPLPVPEQLAKALATKPDSRPSLTADLALSLTDVELPLEATPPPDFSALEWAKIFNAARRNGRPPPTLHLFQYPVVCPDACVIISTTPDDQRRFNIIYRPPGNGLWFLHPPGQTPLHTLAPPRFIGNPSLAFVVAAIMETTTLWRPMPDNDAPSHDGIRIEPILEVS